MYLSVAFLFAAVYGMIQELTPDAFASLYAAAGSEPEKATFIYFSLTTLTSAGYGDNVGVDPFACSLAKLELMIGVFVVAITLARLVALELAYRRR